MNEPKFKILWLILVGIILIAIAGIISRSPSDNSTLPPQPISATNTTPPPQILHPSIPPPKFRIYKFKIDTPVSVLVPVNTTDEQLKSLLWLFREKVRSHQFKDIGLTQATGKQWGNKGYLSGMLSVYRGEKCANEGYMDTIGPCGYQVGVVEDVVSILDGDYNYLIQRIKLTPEVARDWGTKHAYRVAYYTLSAKARKPVWGQYHSSILAADFRKLVRKADSKGWI